MFFILHESIEHKFKITKKEGNLWIGLSVVLYLNGQVFFMSMEWKSALFAPISLFRHLGPFYSVLKTIFLKYELCHKRSCIYLFVQYNAVHL